MVEVSPEKSWYVIKLYFFIEKVKLIEVFRNDQRVSPQEVENVSKHFAISVYEVVLLKTVQHNRNRSVEESRQTAFRVP